MKNFLTSLDLALWMMLIAGQVVLCLCILKKNLVRRLPWFSVYVFAFTVKSIIFLALAFLASYAVYYYGFYVVSHIISALAFLTLIEFGRQVLPGFNLPHNKKALGWFLLRWLASPSSQFSGPSGTWKKELTLPPIWQLLLHSSSSPYTRVISGFIGHALWAGFLLLWVSCIWWTAWPRH